MVPLREEVWSLVDIDLDEIQGIASTYRMKKFLHLFAEAALASGVQDDPDSLALSLH